MKEQIVQKFPLSANHGGQLGVYAKHRNLPIDPPNPCKKRHSYQFQKKVEEASPSSLAYVSFQKMPLMFPKYLALILDGGWNRVSQERKFYK